MNKIIGSKVAHYLGTAAFLYAIINGMFWITASLTTGSRQDKTREEIKEYINQTVDAAITERFPKTTGTVSTGLTKDKNGTTNP